MPQFPPYQEGVVQFFAILGQIASLILAIVACIGLAAYKHWRDEYSGKKKYELALTILTLIEQIKDGFANTRNPFMYGSEDQKIIDNPIGQVIAAYQERHNKIIPLVNDFYKAKIEGEIIFGAKVGDEMNSLIKKHNEFVNMASYYFWEMRKRRRDMIPTDYFMEAEKFVYSNGTGNDKFAEEIGRICKSLNSLLKTYIEIK
jgi:hypothetical protein